jgi:phosphonate transport system substrate-binding protein
MRRNPSPVELVAAPVLQGERYQDRPIYFSDVIVRADSPLGSFADLRGRSWSYNDRDSHSGYNVTRHHLVQMRETRGFFSRVVEAGSHQRSVQLVADGEVDASAIDSQVLAIELRDHPESASQLKIIDTLGPSTIQPVVAARHVPQEVRTSVQWVLFAMGDDPAARPSLDRGFVERFVGVTDSTYDDIRAMLAAAEAAGYLVIR